MSLLEKNQKFILNQFKAQTYCRHPKTLFFFCIFSAASILSKAAQFIFKGIFHKTTFFKFAAVVTRRQVLRSIWFLVYFVNVSLCNDLTFFQLYGKRIFLAPKNHQIYDHAFRHFSKVGHFVNLKFFNNLSWWPSVQNNNVFKFCCWRFGEMLQSRQQCRTFLVTWEIANNSLYIIFFEIFCVCSLIIYKYIFNILKNAMH